MMPPQTAACDRLPPVTSIIRSGITGKISPMPMASSVTVAKMKVRARDWRPNIGLPLAVNAAA